MKRTVTAEVASGVIGILKAGSNFQDNSVLLKAGDFCGCYTQEI